jgi:hypothetical protein
MSDKGDLILTGLFDSERRSKEFVRSVHRIFSDMMYCYSSLDGIMASNQANKQHMELSHRAASLLLAMEILKRAVKNHFREEYQSEESRKVRYDLVDKQMDMNLDYILKVSRGLSYESGLVVYDKCRSFNRSVLNGLKRINPSSAPYLDLVIKVLDEHKYKNDEL